MFAILLLALTVWIGRNLVGVVPVRFYKLEFWAVACIIGLLVTTWLLFLISLLVGYTWGLPIALLIGGLGSYGVYLHFLKKRTGSVVVEKSEKKQKSEATKTKELPALTKSVKLGMAGYLFVWGLLLFSLFFTRSFQDKLGAWYSGGNSWGDIALHSTLIYSFEQHERPPLNFPIYPQNKLTYPFLFDFYTAMLLQTGLNIQQP